MKEGDSAWLGGAACESRLMLIGGNRRTGGIQFAQLDETTGVHRQSAIQNSGSVAGDREDDDLPLHFDTARSQGVGCKGLSTICLR